MSPASNKLHHSQETQALHGPQVQPCTTADPKPPYPSNPALDTSQSAPRMHIADHTRPCQSMPTHAARTPLLSVHHSRGRLLLTGLTGPTSFRSVTSKPIKTNFSLRCLLMKQDHSWHAAPIIGTRSSPPTNPHHHPLLPPSFIYQLSAPRHLGVKLLQVRLHERVALSRHRAPRPRLHQALEQQLRAAGGGAVC
jgi:hypothetical protein